MRQIPRVNRSIDLLRSRPIPLTQSPYLCRACKQRATSFSTSALRAAQSSNNASFTEKLRRKIWGTDNPPGQENPYGDASVFDQTKKREAERKQDEMKQRQVALSEQLADYEPADTWDGLEEVGDYENVDLDLQFRGFLPPHTMQDPAEITASVHRAMVEVLALWQAGRPLNIPGYDPGHDLTQTVQLGFSQSGPTLNFGSQASFEDIVESLTRDPYAEKGFSTDSEGVAADRSTEDLLEPVDANETAVKQKQTESEEDVAADKSGENPLTNTSASNYEELVATWDPSWLQIPLDDPEIKFAVVKRTLKLTGIRLADPLIQRSRTTQHLISHLVVPPKPRKLVDALSQKEDLMTLPNVSVYASRVTPIDKEKSIGRWKLIEKELEERGLPVTGNR